MHISSISEEREKSYYKNGYIPRFEGYSRYFTDIAHAYFTTTTTTKPYLKTLYIQQPQSALQLENYKKKKTS